MGDNDLVTERQCVERHARTEKDIELLFNKTNQKIEKEVCGIHRKKTEEDMTKLGIEVKSAKDLVLTNIIVVIVVGIFMVGANSLGQASANKGIQQAIENGISKTMANIDEGMRNGNRTRSNNTT